jgi:hypothetical protein
VIDSVLMTFSEGKQRFLFDHEGNEQTGEYRWYFFPNHALYQAEP